MAASTSDKLTDTRNAARPVTTTVASGRSAGGTTLSCASLTGWPTASKVHFVTYQVGSNSNPVSGTQLDCYGIVSGSDITSMAVVDGTDTGNSVGDKVQLHPTAAWGQDLSDWGMVEHTRTGTHSAITGTTANFTGAISADTISEHTSAAGVTVDGLLIKDSALATANSVVTANYTDGSIAPEHLVASTGTGWAWQSFTPSWTNLTVGNGTNQSYYAQIGKTVLVRVHFTFGSTSAMGTNPIMTLPVTGTGNISTSTSNIGTGMCYDSGTANYPAVLKQVSTTQVVFECQDASGTYLKDATVTSTVPFTWGTSDEVLFNIMYEAA